MGLVQTILGTKLRVYFLLNDTQGTVFSLDASLSESHSRESPSTDFEIEDGTVISDNIVIKPMKVELHGLISDTPISLGGELLTTAVSVATPPAGVILASAGTLAGQSLIAAIAGSQSPSQKAFSQLLSLQDQRMPFTLFTSLRSYPNMWIESITVPRDPQTGQVLMFTASLKQLLIVAPQTVVTQIFQNPDTGASQADAGRQQTSQLPAGFNAGIKAEQSGISQTIRNATPQ